MVKKSGLLKTMVGIFLTIIIASGVYAQADKEYYALKKYRKWGIIAGPIIYNKAEIYPQYGDYTFENKPMWGFNAGFEYDFYPDKKWSFITGFIVALEPVYNIQYSFKEEDLYPQFVGGDTDKDKMYAMTSFSAPLLVCLNIQAGKKVFINFRTGLKAMYFPDGSASMSVTFHNEDDTEAREMFGLRVDSPLNWVQGSFVIGSGISYATKRVLLKANMIYVMNFQNAMDGEYLFDNMLVSPRSRGYYELSGNYLGLLFSASLAKKKDKW